MLVKLAVAGLGTADGTAAAAAAAAAGIKAWFAGAAASTAGLVWVPGATMVDGVGEQATTGALIMLAAAKAEAVVLAIVGW